MKLIKAIKKLNKHRIVQLSNKDSFLPKPTHYAFRIDRPDDNDYTIVVGDTPSNALRKLSGGPFSLAPDDIDASWKIRRIPN